MPEGRDTAADKWQGPYFDSPVELDPWGRPYQYDPQGGQHNQSFGKPDV